VKRDFLRLGDFSLDEHRALFHRARELKAFTKVEELQTRGLVTARVLSDIRDLVTTR